MIDMNLCYYANRTKNIQILKVRKGDDIIWERVVFSHQRLFFFAQFSDNLEVYERIDNQPAKIGTITCQYLLVSEVPVRHILANPHFR